ncbi:MAG: hypothetical protein ACTSRP_19160 [Candidatus Helarchaeota archaeon]
MDETSNKIVDEIVRLIEDAYNPRETREFINNKYPEYNDNEKLKSIIPKVLQKFDRKKQQYLKKTEYMNYFLIAGKDIVKSRTDK